MIRRTKRRFTDELAPLHSRLTGLVSRPPPFPLMNTEPTTSSVSATPFNDDVWDDLLNYIEEKRVIPIIGPELLKVQTENGPQLLLEWLAEKLAVRLNVDSAPLPKALGFKADPAAGN
jgi:hypothetical protein